MTARRTGSAPQKPGPHLPVPAFSLLAAQLFPPTFFSAAWPGSGIGPPAGVDPCVLLPLVSLGIRL